MAPVQSAPPRPGAFTVDALVESTRDALDVAAESSAAIIRSLMVDDPAGACRMLEVHVKIVAARRMLDADEVTG